MEQLFEPTMDFYMCLKDGAPLCGDRREGEWPIVFEDVTNASDARDEFGNEELVVAAVEPATIVQTLREGGYTHLFYKPVGAPGGIMDLDTFAGVKT